jgi:hypothetical protein
MILSSCYAARPLAGEPYHLAIFWYLRPHPRALIVRDIDRQATIQAL